MIHLDALPGYPQHEGMSKVVEHALYDAHQLEDGGIDSILLENTYDDPQQKILGTEQIVAFTVAAQKVKENTQVPLGICCLFNDYKSALSIAKVVGADFVRVPVFTEAALTSYGFIESDRFARIQENEKKFYVTTLMAEFGNEWKKLKPYLNTKNAHDILDNIG